MYIHNYIYIVYIRISISLSLYIYIYIYIRCASRPLASLPAGASFRELGRRLVKARNLIVWVAGIPRGRDNGIQGLRLPAQHVRRLWRLHALLQSAPLVPFTLPSWAGCQMPPRSSWHNCHSYPDSALRAFSTDSATTMRVYIYIYIYICMYIHTCVCIYIYIYIHMYYYIIFYIIFITAVLTGIQRCVVDCARGRSCHGRNIVMYYNILYYTILYYTILYYTVLYCTVLYYTVLYCTVLYY